MGLKMINQNLRIGHFFKDVGSDSIDFEFYEVSKLTDKRVYYIYETKSRYMDSDKLSKAISDIRTKKIHYYFLYDAMITQYNSFERIYQKHKNIFKKL